MKHWRKGIEMKPYLTPDEVGKLLNVSRQHVIGLIDGGRLRAINVSVGRRRARWRIRAVDIHEFLDENTVNADAGARA